MMQKYGDLWRPQNYPKKRKASNPAFENGNTGSVTFSDLEDRSSEKEGVLSIICKAFLGILLKN